MMSSNVNMSNKPLLKKSRTFQLIMKSSGDAPPPPPPPEAVAHAAAVNLLVALQPPPPQRSATSFPIFPTSPQVILGEEITHFGHPQHPLAEMEMGDLFTCAGCKEYGSGKRFTCQLCDFQLHLFCAYAPQSLKNHPFHCHHLLLFFSKPVKGGIMKSRCDVCGKATKGYTFRCSAGSCSFQMHPCCAMLSTEINYPLLHPHTLNLLPAAAVVTNNNNNNNNGIGGGGGDQKSNNNVCGECKRKQRSGSRVFRCRVCDNYQVHAACAKDAINGLLANNIKLQKPGNSKLGAAARIASQVVIDFIGGLIEGLGEGVGEAFVSDVTARGPRPRGRAPTPLAVNNYKRN